MQQLEDGPDASPEDTKEAQQAWIASGRDQQPRRTEATEETTLAQRERYLLATKER